MADLPPLKYGRVKARFVAGIGDGPDAGFTPDVEPLTGTVSFNLSAAVVRVVTAEPVPTTVYPRPITARVDSDGYLTWEGERFVPLLATDDPAMSPTDLQWTVSFDLRSPDGYAVPATPWRFELPAGTVVDLTEVAPLVEAASNMVITKGDKGDPGPNTIPTNAAIAAAVGTEGDAQEAVAVVAARVSGAIRNARAEGADGRGSTAADGRKLNDALARLSADGGGDFYIPSGTYLTDAQIVLPPNVSLILDPASYLIPTVGMGALLTLASPDWGSNGSGWSYERSIRGGVFDCAAKASKGIELTGFKGFSLHDLKVENWLTDGVVMGTNPTHSSYEGYVSGLRLDRDPASPNPAGSRGLVINSTDSRIYETVSRGAETGVLVDQSYTYLEDVHVWSWEKPVNGNGTNLHKWGFVDRKDGSTYVGCDSDTPSVAGWLLGGSYTKLVSPRVFLNDYAITDAATGFAVMYPGSRPTFIGAGFASSSPAKRLLQDLGGPSVARPSWLNVTVEPAYDWTTTDPYVMGLGMTAVGTSYRGAAPATRRMDSSLMAGASRVRSMDVVGGGLTGALKVTRPDASDVWRLDDNGSVPFESLNRGGQWRGFRGNYGTETIRLDAATGSLHLGSPDTGRNVRIQSYSGDPRTAPTQPGPTERVLNINPSTGRQDFWDGATWTTIVNGKA